MQNTQNLDMREFCSRKLWDMVNAEAQGRESEASEEELIAAVQELAQRRHYLVELEKIGKLQRPN